MSNGLRAAPARLPLTVTLAWMLSDDSGRYYSYSRNELSFTSLPDKSLEIGKEIGDLLFTGTGGILPPSAVFLAKEGYDLHYSILSDILKDFDD